MYEEIITEDGTVMRRQAYDLRAGNSICKGRATVISAVYSDPACDSVGVMAITIVRQGKPDSITVSVEADRVV